MGANGDRYFEARAWESIDRRFETLERHQADTAAALTDLAKFAKDSNQTTHEYIERQQRFWRSWRVVIAGVAVGLATVLIPILTFLHSVHVFGWR